MFSRSSVRPAVLLGAWLAAAAAAAATETAAATGPVKSPSELSVIKPGHDGVYGVYVAPPVKTARKLLGTLAGRDIMEVDTPVKVSGMGKYMAEDTRGNIWFVETREDKAIKIDPVTLEMTQYFIPRGAAPYSIAIDSKDVVWITAHGIEMLLELHPEKGIVRAHQPPSHGFLIHINVDRRTDTVWFTQPGNNQVVSYKPGSGFREYPSPTKQSGPGRLDFDSKGNVWFPELYTDKLARLQPRTGKITEWPVPSKKSLPAGVRVERSDDTIWVSQPMADRLAAFRDGKWIGEYQIPTPGSVVSTNVSDEDGFVWFTEGGWRGSAGGNKVGRLDPRTREVLEFTLPYENAQPLGMIRGQDGSIWFSLVTGSKVCRILPRKQTSQEAGR
jgi:virginiamycin B lyase